MNSSKNFISVDGFSWSVRVSNRDHDRLETEILFWLTGNFKSVWRNKCDVPNCRKTCHLILTPSNTALDLENIVSAYVVINSEWGMNNGKSAIQAFSTCFNCLALIANSQLENGNAHYLSWQDCMEKGKSRPPERICLMYILEEKSIRRKTSALLVDGWIMKHTAVL